MAYNPFHRAGAVPLYTVCVFLSGIAAKKHITLTKGRQYILIVQGAGDGVDGGVAVTVNAGGSLGRGFCSI